MYCPRCGTQNPDNAANCSACGAVLQQAKQYQGSTNSSNQTNDQQYQNYNGYGSNQNGGNNQYQNYQQYGTNMQSVPNYLVQSILVTLFCCLPLGILSIITSKQVDDKLRMGDYNGAVEASKKAKKYCLISLGVGIAVGVIYFLFSFLAVLLG